MSSIPGVLEILALLDTLKNAVREFAGREEKLQNDLRTRSAAELKSFETASADQAAQSAAADAQADADLEAGRRRAESAAQRRKTRINKAHNAVRKKVVEDITEKEGQQKYRVQEGTLGAERRRDADFARASGVLEEFNHRAVETRDAFGALEFSAAQAFWAYGRLRKLLAHDRTWPEPDLSGDENRLYADLEQLRAKTAEDIARFRKILLPQVFRFLPLWLFAVLLLGFAASVPVLQRFGITLFSPRDALIAAAAFIIVLGLYFIGRHQAQGPAMKIAENLGKARRMLEACFQKAEAHYLQERETITKTHDEAVAALNQQWRQSVKEALRLRSIRPMEVDQTAQRLYEVMEQYHRAGLERLDREHKEAKTLLAQKSGLASKSLADAHRARMQKIEADNQAAWAALQEEWNKTMQPLCRAIASASEAAARLFPEWEISRWEQWNPPETFQNAAKFGRLEVDLAKFAENLPRDPRLALPCPEQFSVPLAVIYPNHASLLFEASKAGHHEAISAINNVIFRLLSTTPPGKISFTIFDPVGLGQNFAGLMHLADYEERHINSRIWTQQNQFEEKLAELNEHMEKVIQMYLRNEYETIAEYNAQAGTIAEKYHILVIASFPANFSDTAARRLRNIATSGARCGVYTLIHWDQRLAAPADFVPDELRKNSANLVWTGNGYVFANWRNAGTRVILDEPPSPEFATHFLHKVGESGKDSNRVEVPFEQIAPAEPEIWTKDTTEEVRVPIGRSGATKLQYLEIGKGTRQHGLIAGKTGSGKSTLFHVIITNLALWCSPEQVEFYLVDFKKGVEFKGYAARRLPHAKVVAIESDREFGLSVLQRVDAELRRRGDLFRQLGVQDLAGYKRAGGKEPMPRSLLIIDEFQEFFTEEDRVSQGAAVLLDRIVRQGRAFGIHVLLGSQTLGGAYTLARATLGQMVIRIALQCNEADAYLIMDQDNPAPRLLSRPGEGIYNDSAGSIEGNSPFQAVWLPEPERDDQLARIRERADRQDGQYPGPFVFEGNAPADVRDNPMLAAALRAQTIKPALPVRMWLGAPNSIKGPTEALFQRQSGSNLLIVGQNEESSLSLLGVGLVSLASQFPKGAVKFVLLDSSAPDSHEREFVDRVVAAVPHPIARARGGDVIEVIQSLYEELKRRNAEGEAAGPETFLFIQGLQNYKKLRQEDEFSFSTTDANSPAAMLLNLITDGSAHGIHVIATCDTYTNVNRFLGRKNLAEFEMRVLFQMSASDSASLIDDPGASTLGLNRALYYNDREGYLETFRPYARPANEWIEEVAGNLKRLAD